MGRRIITVKQKRVPSPPARAAAPKKPPPLPSAPPQRRVAAPSLEQLTGGRTSPVVARLPADIRIPSKPKEKPAVSLWSTLGKAATKGISAGITSRLQSKIAPAAILPAVAAAAPRVLPAIGRVLTGRSAAAATTGVMVGQMIGGNGANGGGVCPPGQHPNKQDGIRGPAGTYCVRNRRMNFGNARAARRSVRRLKGARKLLQDIERMMPRRPAPRARAHHHHPAAGG